ncbi:ferritin-like domain-containing protein [Aquimarina sp. RZ0]|uniref:ferritin-like domain-containing protein n=1 Tax=Aquimarina sp. RZ0 TaxID=2607730 RepID=UPI0011F30366|nr:ferritin-like domain-containing protein [Aquimarina sp. RZ0]KAA1247024.1 hypothetical protein F0000_04890 [Aquimarina sp. RZ0]
MSVTETQITATTEITTREELICYLKEAVELEMTLMVQYIYAAYSVPNLVTGKEYVKRGLWSEEQLSFMCGDGEERMDQGARGLILGIAKEEMIHFLMANNLLMAIGGTFYVSSPSYSKVSKFYPVGLEMALEPFSKNSIERFMHLESPHTFVTEGKNQPQPGTDLAYTSVSDLYRKIKNAFIKFPEFISVEKGKTGGEHHLFLNEKTNTLFPSYQCRVDDVQSAIFAIDLIAEQGEGVPTDDKSLEESHFNKFRKIKEYLENHETPLMYPCLKNPSVHGEIGTIKVTNEVAKEAMYIFNECFGISMQMMTQHFGLRPTETLRRSYLMNASIDIMSGVMRYLGIFIMNIESGIEKYTAGPSFELPKPIIFITDHDKALAQMSAKFKELHTRAVRLEILPPSVVELLEYFVEYTRTLE